MSITFPSGTPTMMHAPVACSGVSRQVVLEVVEPSVKAVTEEGLWAETTRLLHDARMMQQYPADRSADILYLRTSAAAHDLMGVVPDGG